MRPIVAARDITRAPNREERYRSPIFRRSAEQIDETRLHLCFSSIIILLKVIAAVRE